MPGKSFHCCGVGLLAIAAGWPAALAAQDIEAGGAEAGDSIIVTGARENSLQLESTTGSRMGLSVLETPATVNTLDGDDIRALGDLNFLDAISRAPGVTMSASPGDGNTALSLRGFTGQGSIMQLFGGVRLFPNNGTVTFPFDTWNVERIEVLSGPGSVLYGQGALGGVVNVVPTSPIFDRYEGRAEAAYGSFDSVRVAAGLGGPIADKLAFRVDGILRTSNGYVERGESQSVALSGSLEYRPTETLSINLRHDYGDNQPMQYWGTPLAEGTTLDTSIREQNYNVRDAVIDWRDNRTQVSIDWTPAEGMKLFNTAYYLDSRREWQNLENYFYDTGAGVVERSSNFGIVHNVEQYGNQAYASYKAPLGGGISNQILVGFDVNLIRLNYEHSFASDPQEDAVDPFNPDPGFFLNTAGLLPRYRTRTANWAVYAEDRVELGEQFSIIGGARYEENTVERFNFVYNEVGNTIIGETPALAGGAETKKRFKDFTWRLGAVYQPVPDIALYGQYATGVDPVGTLTSFTPSAAQFGFTNARGNQIEVGAKALFLGGAGAATVSLYRIVKNDLAVQQIPNGPIEQVGQQSSQGVEATLSLDLPWGLSVNANGTILDARFDDFPSGAADFTGNTPPNVPEEAANLFLQWTPRERLRLGGGVRYVGARLANNSNTLTVDAYTVVDLTASYALAEGFAIDARVFNLLDEDYAIATYGAQQWVLGRPQAFEVAFRAAF